MTTGTEERGGRMWIRGTRRTALIATVAAILVMPLQAGAQEECCEGPPCCGDPETGELAGEALGLEEAVRTALERNREVQAARYQLEEADRRVGEAWGNLYPTVELSTSYTRNLSPAVNFVPAKFFDPDASADELVPLQFGADNQWSGILSLDQPLFDGAAIIGVGAAGRFEALQEEILRGEVQRVVTAVRETYYDLLLAQEQARLIENSVRRVRESLGETQALNRAGLASDYDVLRLEVELANLEPNLLRARNAVRQARRALGVALDLENGAELRVAGSLASMDIVDPERNSPENRAVLDFVGIDLEGGVTPDGVDRLARRASEARSDVRQLELTESLRKTEMRLEQVSYLPKISVFGTYSVQASQNGDPEFFGFPRAYGRQAGVQVTLPVFQGLQRDARVDQKRAVMRAAGTQTALARDRAASQVETLVDQVEEARARARGQALAVEQARRGFDIARAQFREGLGSQLELTDAEVALRQSEFNYAEAVYDFLVARARLDQATGEVPLVDGTPIDPGTGDAGAGR